MRPKLEVIDLGKKDYQQTYQLQLELVKKRANNEITDTLLLVEHPPVFTIGRSGSRDNITVSQAALKEVGISVYETNRGGDITYHGPGQLVGYPILNLKEHQQDLHWLLRNYEEVFIRVLKDLGIKAKRIEELTGVWVGEKKITAIGIGVKHWVTYHGFAFNIAPNLEHFNYIIPCGIVDKGVTSLKELLAAEIKREEIIKLVIKQFIEVFEMELMDNEQQIS
ncbi:lipoyl(octanoyl) transferase LipB [Fuchsiella alkaliacetigena]|uniref:lipoyl(octanoyl) transferase LipB n=1 Tax=Fuchsiella alkaliacetigena TaxID=957042 RepID=UPI00200AED6C|nr:lipoyl(octanoyl) transferase LipB [Fuchsiella alkaliacetigena]